jgi:tRNA nucleotidyltransferase/poly(A) polymerase
MNSDARTLAVDIVVTLRDAGHEAFIVGGAVRDMVMGREPKDYDIATSASPAEVAAIFPRVEPVGAQFGVVLVLQEGIPFEVAMFRTEGVYRDGRRPNSVAPATLDEDLHRRDFTVNALIFDPVTDSVIDRFGGRDDIESGIIRTVGDPCSRFAEDRLRMLRAIRFATRLDFSIEESALAAIQKCAPDVGTVSAERIRDELIGIFCGPHPGRGLALLDETGLLQVVLPEVAAMKNVPQPEAFHPEGDVFEHTRLMLDHFGGGPVTLALAVLLHDVGKPSTITRTDRIRFNLHDKAGADIAGMVLRRLRFDRRTIDRVESLVRDHMRFKDVPQMRRATLRRFMAGEGFDELLALYRLDCLASHGSLDIHDSIVREREHEPALPEPLVSGVDLISMGFREGPEVGVALADIRELQLEGAITTTAAVLSRAAELLAQRER